MQPDSLGHDIEKWGPTPKSFSPHFSCSVQPSTHPHNILTELSALSRYGVRIGTCYLGIRLDRNKCFSTACYGKLPKLTPCLLAKDLSVPSYKAVITGITLLVLVPFLLPLFLLSEKFV
jgi:hypothetical protein